MLPVSAVNDPALLRQLRRFVSINGALAIDLLGQVAADYIGGRQYSGVGGAESFVMGASEAPGGKSLLCLESTATVDGRRISTIVPRLGADACVTTPRHHVQWVVTEHGAADLSVLDRRRAGARAHRARASRLPRRAGTSRPVPADSARMSTATIGSLDLYYEEHGSGEPLLLIMGLAADSTAWMFQIPELRRAATARSSSTTAASGAARSRPGPYTIHEMADDAAGLLDVLDVPRAHVVGVSMGGMIAQELALRHPERVRGLVLACTYPEPDADIERNRRFSVAAVRRLDHRAAARSRST